MVIAVLKGSPGITAKGFICLAAIPAFVPFPHWTMSLRFPAIPLSFEISEVDIAGDRSARISMVSFLQPRQRRKGKLSSEKI